MTMKTVGYAAIVAVAAMTLTIAVSGPSFAKAKKAEAPVSPSCQLELHKAVCGVRGGMRQTYANSCYALHDGAKIVSKGACKAHKKMSAKKPAMKKAAPKK